MIVDKETKSFVERNDMPFENWTKNDEKYYLVDSNSELAKKIRLIAPDFEFILNDDGSLIDIFPTEPDQLPGLEPSVAEQLAQAQEQLAMLTDCIMEMSEIIYA